MGEKGELIPLHVREEQLAKKPETPIMAKMSTSMNEMLIREKLIRIMSIYINRLEKWKWMGKTMENSS